MAQVTITIPDNKLDLVVEALCFGTQLEPTPANAKQVVIDVIKYRVRDYLTRTTADDVTLT